MQQKEFKVGGAGAITTLVVLTLLLLMNQADRAILNIALQPIKVAFDLSDTEAGSLVSIFTLGIAIFTIPVSIFGDRWGRRKIVGLMALIWSVFTLTTGLATQKWHLFTSRFMVGAGEAGYVTAGMTWVGLSFKKEKRSLILGIFSVGGIIGSVIGLAVGGWVIATTHDWRNAFYFFAIPGIVLAICSYFLPDYKTARAEGEGLLSKAFFKGWGDFLKIKTFWLSTCGVALFHFSVQGATAWTAALLMRQFGLNTMQAGLTYGATGIATLVGMLLGGFIADRWQRRNKNGRPYVIIISMAFNLAALFITYTFLIHASLTLFAVGLWVMAFFFGLLTPIYLSIGLDVTPLHVKISAMGLSNFIIHMTGATLGPVLVGAISDAAGGGASGIATGILWASSLSIVGLLIYLLVPRFYPSDSAKITDRAMAEK
jgi:MFS family permease